MGIETIVLEAIATPDTFHELAYLAPNPDVAAAVRAGSLTSGRAHYESFGRTERRRQRFPDAERQLAILRSKKMARLEPFLDISSPHTTDNGVYNFLSPELRSFSGVASTENVSGHSYDADIWRLIESTSDGLILDCGAGKRDIYVSSVVNYEIVPYNTTDILGVGEKLPFKDCTFDGVISVAVMEHVKFPFLCANEIARVLKPGGWLFCAVPFLQPYHGYPHHYFNMTYQGIRALFEETLDIEQIYVSDALRPIWALSWIIKAWADGLPGIRREEFLQLRLADVAREASGQLAEWYVQELPDRINMELASGNVMLARKRPRQEAPNSESFKQVVE